MMLRRVYFAIALGCLISCSTSTASAQVVGDTLTASNTFESVADTGSVETIFGLESATVIDPGVELTQFAGLYDFDFGENSFSMTLTGNSVPNQLYGAGTFDRYYVGFDGHLVDSISVSGGDVELTDGLTVGLLAPGFELDVADLFGTGIPVPIEYPNGGFVLQFGEGTDIRTLGRSVNFDFTTTAVPEPTSGVIFSVGGLVLLTRHRRR